MRSNAYCGNLLWQSGLTRQAPMLSFTVAVVMFVTQIIMLICGVR